MEKERIPGDVFLSRFMPQATFEDREEARKNLYAFAEALLRIATRRASEDCEAIRANGVVAVDSEGGALPPI